MLSIKLLLFAAGAMMLAVAAAGAAQESRKKPVVILETSLGAIHLELDPEKAPISVKNFLDYVRVKHFDGLIFHRVIPGFMIQGGGFEPDMRQKRVNTPIKNEAGNGLKNDRGTIAMARTNVVDSATAQFFINVKDNASLNHRDETAPGFGYAVFGRVIQGIDVVDKIVSVPTTTKGSYGDVPVEPVIIKSAAVKE